MKRLLLLILRYVSYLTAAIVILLAVAVGLFRLLLPRLPEYQDQIKDWANAAIGLPVEFSGMNARWRLSGPELSFRDAEIGAPDSVSTLLTADEVSVGVSLIRLMRDRELVVDRILVRDTRIEIRQDEQGAWQIQGIPLADLPGSRDVPQEQVTNVALIGEDIRVEMQHPDTGQLLPFHVDSLQIVRSDQQIDIDADVELPEGFGNRVDLSATRRTEEGEPGHWQVYVEGDSLDVPAWSALQRTQLPGFSSGSVDVSLWVELSPAGISSATANFAAYELAPDVQTLRGPFGLQGRVEFSKDTDGFLLAGSQFRLLTPLGNWPQTAWRLRITKDPQGATESVQASASFLNLDDMPYLAPWMPERQRDLGQSLSPSGQLHDLEIRLSDLGEEAWRFHVAAQMEDVGFAAYEQWPGMRGFSGRLRADEASGRLEIDAVDTSLDFSGQLPAPVDLDDIYGTIIWRRNDAGITVLSDSVQLRNADLDSQISLQVSLPANDDSPLVDLDVDWSFNDIGAVGRYLPEKLVRPALYRWFTTAFVAGTVRRGKIRFDGPLERFPFDGGEGVFRVDAQVEDATLQYAPGWPAATNIQADMVIENMRLYSVSNTSMNEGNSVRDARVEIADLREPVLTIDAFATGTLESIIGYSRASPIGGLFGGHLDRLQVDGDASFNVLLTYPITERENYDFSTRIQASDGTIRLAGFPAALSELNGVVTISRDAISSDALFGRFLGQPVDISLQRAPAEMPAYSVIMDASGRVGAPALISEFGMPVDGLLVGETDYHTRVLFPSGNGEVPAPLQIRVESELQGVAMQLPAPLDKAPGDKRPLSLVIEFPQLERITASGSLSDELRWTAGFEHEDNGWEFDRGMLAVGGTYPGTADTRGLHIEGEVAELRLGDWLELASRGDGGSLGLGDRIRSIDLEVDDLYVIGQHLVNHRVVVNRSALDWVAQLDGEQAAGTVTIPYDFHGGRSLTLDMTLLTLPGDDSAVPGAGGAIDPRTLPPISVAAEEFALGDRHFGRLTVDLLRTEQGLAADALLAEDPSFSVAGSAGWIIDESDQTGQRSYVAVKLRSNNIEETMRRLDYQPGLVGDDMEINLDISWSGGPRHDFLGSLDGTVDVRIGDGQLAEVDPGAGRVFGLMSVVALPRRLSLDFSDVFDKGFGFDQITGTFRIANGDAYTCDLSLNGPAADVGIVGRAGLLTRDYNQTAIVSANVGNTLPVIGAAVAGPQVAAALLIFSQIFKKPLQEMGQIYYGIEGSWDDPSIEVATAVRFAASSGLAGCIETSD